MWKSKFYGAFVLNRRVDLHAIFMISARWRGDVGSSPLHPTHWLISAQVPNADADDGDAPDVTIFDKDDSVVYLDYPGYEDYGKERKQEISDSVRSRKKADADDGGMGYSPRAAELTSL